MVTRVAILHFATPPIVGGVESTIDHHARLLAEVGYEVEVIGGRGAQFSSKVGFHRIPLIDSRHPDVLSVGAALAEGSVTPEFYALQAQIVETLRPILSSTQVCIVHNAITLHKNLALTAALWQLADENVTQLIAWCHDFAWQDALYTPDLHPGYPWDLLRTAWAGVRYVVVSEHRRERLTKLLQLSTDQIEVITPGVDIAEFLKLDPLIDRLVHKLNLLAADPMLILPARITRRKNIEFAIRVTAAVSGQKPQARLIVTGPPGPHNPKNVAYLEELQTLATDLGALSHVNFLYQYGEGDDHLQLPDACVADLYRLADALIFPSRREGFGIPVLEAGLARLPVFAADIPTVEESAGQWAHRFDPDGNPQRVANQILDHLENNPGYQLHRRVIHQFSWQSIVQNQLVPLIEATHST